MTPPLLEFVDAAKRYGTRTILRRVCLSVDEGATVGLIGPNGSGKTTLLRMAVGLLRPTFGIVSLFGRPAIGCAARMPVAYFAGESTLPDGVSASTWSALVAGRRTEVRETRRIAMLSRGTRQLIGLQTILEIPSPLLVLDEPWESLDPGMARWLTGRLRAKSADGVGVLVSSHRLVDLAGICDRYAFLFHGSVACVAAADLWSGATVTGERLMAAYDCLAKA